MIFDIEYWENKLNRNLNDIELSIIQNANNEHEINTKILKIDDVCNKYDLYIPELTKLNGNCLFDTLKYNNLCNDVNKFRYGLSQFLIFFKDKKQFIPNQDLSLEELFNIGSDVSYVKCIKTKKIYKYSFTMMCIDLAKNGSWEKLHTQLILSALTVLLNIKIVIVHNYGNLTEIETIVNNNTKTIYMGLIDEFHYIPIMLKENKNSKYNCPIYLDSNIKFNKWIDDIICVDGIDDINCVNVIEFNN
jgi:hypothetical protein